MPKQQTSKSLSDFVFGQTREKCPVCQLPKDVRAQLGSAAAKRGISRPKQLAWLHKCQGATKITLDVFNAHLNSRHDRNEGFDV